ncbi:Ig-like domain-containing protein, partial [Caldithrix abyssi]
VQINLDDYVSDPDNADSEMSWTYAGNKELIVSIDANRVATISTPDSNWNGSETITFTATDPGGLSDSDTARFTVNPVNDAPRIVDALPDLFLSEDDSLFVPFSFWHPFVEDADTPDCLLQFALTQGAQVKSKVLNDGHRLFADADWFGIDSLFLKVSDGVNLDSGRVMVHVAAVNDPPQIVGFPDSLTFFKGDSLKLLLTPFARDIDSPLEKLSWQFSLSDSQIAWDYSAQTQTLTLWTDTFSGSAYLFARLIDDSSAFDQDTAVVAVKDTLTGLQDLTHKPLDYRLFQNFPNPFNPATTISFYLKQNALVRLEFFDVRGRSILPTHEKYFSSGQQKINIVATHLPSGVYFYRLTVLQNERILFRKIKKMILLK